MYYIPYCVYPLPYIIAKGINVETLECIKKESMKH